jgi:hypothetical protein
MKIKRAKNTREKASLTQQPSITLILKRSMETTTGKNLKARKRNFLSLLKRRLMAIRMATAKTLGHCFVVR